MTHTCTPIITHDPRQEASPAAIGASSKRQNGLSASQLTSKGSSESEDKTTTAMATHRHLRLPPRILLKEARFDTSQYMHLSSSQTHEVLSPSSRLVFIFTTSFFFDMYGYSWILSFFFLPPFFFCRRRVIARRMGKRNPPGVGSMPLTCVWTSSSKNN